MAVNLGIKFKWSNSHFSFQKDVKSDHKVYHWYYLEYSYHCTQMSCIIFWHDLLFSKVYYRYSLVPIFKLFFKGTTSVQHLIVYQLSLYTFFSITHIYPIQFLLYSNEVDRCLFPTFLRWNRESLKGFI